VNIAITILSGRSAFMATNEGQATTA